MPTRSSRPSIFRYLIFQTRQRARARLFTFKYDTLPYYGQRARSRIYRFIANRLLKHKQRKEAGKTILGRLRRSRRLFTRLQKNDARLLTVPNMSQEADLKDSGSSSGSHGSLYGRGSRRRKLADYLKAANELRQSYQSAYGLGGQTDGEAEESGARSSGAYSDVSVVRAEDEELVLFPSYARQHHARRRRQLEPPGAVQDIRENDDSGNTEYWRKQWAEYEEDNSIVDVDVRGWVYSPHRGAMTRKNRVLLGLARHLSGIPAPAGGNGSAISGEALGARQDEDLVEKEADSILRRGKAEADFAQRGQFSEQPTSVTPAAGRDLKQDNMKLRGSSNSLWSVEENAPGPGLLSKKTSWNQPSEMSPSELAVANAHLMARLKPFLTNPLVSIPVTIFFYNEKTSKSRTITTDESGHFSLRAALGFIPTHVRVLASEHLSTTEEVRIVEPTGVSMISDIDDTIKHSAIGSGAKEIFRNIFIRDLGDLTIEGVREWYSKMADLGVNFHYVSNSPWQLYPLLVSFFTRAGLPKGSFHLKQYSGMLQGIFEPVAERKKGTLERIMQDFPRRRFILVGDSGEADLELYTEVLLSNPGRILGVFIRDVTTTRPQGFFDSSVGKLRNQHESKSTLTVGQTTPVGDPVQSILRNEDKRPRLPPRRQSRSSSSLRVVSNGPLGGGSEHHHKPQEKLHRSMTESTLPTPSKESPNSSIKTPPSLPLKPLALRSRPSGHRSKSYQITPETNSRKPPLPPNPSQSSTSQASLHRREGSPLSQNPTTPPRTNNRGTSAEPQGYRSAVINKITSTYNALPAWSNPLTSSQPEAAPLPQPPPQKTPPTNLPDYPSQPKPPPSSSPSSSTLHPPIPPPPRRNLSSYPAAAAHYASNRLSGGWSGSSNSNGSSDDSNGNTVPINKKEDIWNRRWARARDLFEAKGVVLKTWRVGSDVLDDSIALVEKAGREEETKKMKGEERS